MAEVAIAALGVSLVTLAVNGTSTAMQAHQMRKEKKKPRGNNGLVPYGGIASAQQSSTTLVPYGSVPPQYSQIFHPQPSPEHKPCYTTEDKINASSSPAHSPRPSLDAQSGWTTMQKVETTTYYVQNGQPISADSKQGHLQPVQSYPNYTSPPPSPLPSPSYIAYTSQPSSPLLPPPAQQQQQQQQQWIVAQGQGYIPGQGQISGFYQSAPQYMASPPPYTQPLQPQAQPPKRHRLRPWS